MTEDVISNLAAVEINEKQGRGVMPKSTCGVKSWKYTFCQKVSKLSLGTISIKCGKPFVNEANVQFCLKNLKIGW